MPDPLPPVPGNVDAYLSSLLLPPDADLDAAAASAADANLPNIAIAPLHGKLLHLLAKSVSARTILEIGTLAGYSTLWLAKALLPGGHLHTLEMNPAHARIAQANFARAGLADRITLHLGLALETLPTLASHAPFDFIFIDADKANIPAYFTHALRLSRPGTLIFVDNVIRKGAVLEDATADPNIQGVRRFNELLAAEQKGGRITATTIQTVSTKGYDGFALICVNASHA